MSKKDFSERDICTKFITPAIEQAGWDIQTQVREEVSFTDGRIIVRGKLHSRVQTMCFTTRKTTLLPQLKLRRLVLGSCEAAPYTRRAPSARGDTK